MANIGERVIDGARAPAGYEQLAVAATAISPSSLPAATANRPGATGVLITVETAAVRWRDDGVAPTTSVGNPLDPGLPFFYAGDPVNLQFIRSTSVSAVVNLNYFF